MTHGNGQEDTGKVKGYRANQGAVASKTNTIYESGCKMTPMRSCAEGGLCYKDNEIGCSWRNTGRETDCKVIGCIHGQIKHFCKDKDCDFSCVEVIA